MQTRVFDGRVQDCSARILIGQMKAGSPWTLTLEEAVEQSTAKNQIQTSLSLMGVGGLKCQIRMQMGYLLR